jgi:osmotically-inducible protein OsmY
VAADTFGSAVRLTGCVRTWAEHDAVVSATWMANGVTEVIDELEVTS